jgi:hypothetical protein
MGTPRAHRSSQEEAYDDLGDAVRADHAPDPSGAHLRRGAFELAQGWPRRALGSARRALFHEERVPYGHADDARALERSAIGALAAEGAYWPHADDARAWLQSEVEAPSLAQLQSVLSTAIRATRGDAGAALATGARATLEAMLRCAEAGRLLPEYAGRSFALRDERRAVVRAARAWAPAQRWMWGAELERERPPAPSPFEQAERLCAERRYVEAAAAFAEVAANDASLLVDCMGLCERAGEAARVACDLDGALALLELAHRGHQVWASWSTSGGEGMSRMVDVERLAREVEALRHARGSVGPR